MFVEILFHGHLHVRFQRPMLRQASAFFLITILFLLKRMHWPNAKSDSRVTEVLFTLLCFILVEWHHRDLNNIDCLMISTACLVCFISTVNGHSKKKIKKG